MTRFARAKGSKSSNERAPENSTPWEVMKEQLLQSKKDVEESKNREQAEKQRLENYENFLKERKTQKRKATWCDFPESQVSILSNSNQASAESVKDKKKKQRKSSEQSQLTLDQTIQNEVSDPQQSKKKSKKNKFDNNNATEHTTGSKVQPTEVKGQCNESKKGKINKQNISLTAKNSEKQGNAATESGQPESKRKKNKKVKVSDEGKTPTDNQQSYNKSNGNEGTKNNQIKKKKKQVNGEYARRKPVNDNSFQLIINGKEIELVRYDGFPIMKKDAERLEELKTSMIKKGIPKSEVQRTMKLERRRAEKALARVKRDVCYNCRKGGHNLSDCPELKTKIPGVGAADGLCFKCGSTEHRQFECKVQRDKEFRFATCFICKEPGHIARQCPDNPKSLYPNGGSCKLCGDVTHLRKDCPTVQDKREDSSIKLQTLDSGELEAIPLKTKSTGAEEQVAKKPKKITF